MSNFNLFLSDSTFWRMEWSQVCPCLCSRGQITSSYKRCQTKEIKWGTEEQVRTSTGQAGYAYTNKLKTWSTFLPPTRPRGTVWLTYRLLIATASSTVYLWPRHQVLGHGCLLGLICSPTDPKIHLLIPPNNARTVLNPTRVLFL